MLPRKARNVEASTTGLKNHRHKSDQLNKGKKRLDLKVLKLSWVCVFLLSMYNVLHACQSITPWVTKGVNTIVSRYLLKFRARFQTFKSAMTLAPVYFLTGCHIQPLILDTSHGINVYKKKTHIRRCREWDFGCNATQGPLYGESSKEMSPWGVMAERIRAPNSSCGVSVPQSTRSSPNCDTCVPE